MSIGLKGSNNLGRRETKERVRLIRHKPQEGRYPHPSQDGTEIKPDDRRTLRENQTPKGGGPRPRVIRKYPEGEGRPREVPSSISGETDLEKKRVATGEKLQG